MPSARSTGVWESSCGRWTSRADRSMTILAPEGKARVLAKGFAVRRAQGGPTGAVRSGGRCGQGRNLVS
jgi:uncharacterized cupin superfamily protein